jgi:hypothetical protein
MLAPYGSAVRRLVTTSLGLALCAVAACDPEPAYECTAAEHDALYEKRIAPLLAEDRPSSCNECHLSGVDLGLFVQKTPCETMACMVEKEIVDLEDPEASLVLAWIDRATPSGGITQRTIDEERDGMLEWIRRSSACDGECGEIENPCGDPATAQSCELSPTPDAPHVVDEPGDCSDRTLELLFREKIYSWRGRCFPCHFDSNAGEVEDAPSWIVTVGDCNATSLATLRNAEALGMLDPDDPMKSTLLLKPLDVALGGVEHGGGPKMHTTEEAAYVDFVEFLSRWAECR